ncbi:MAG: dockerin type I repeat-containing protein [Bacillota bacterium]
MKNYIFKSYFVKGGLATLAALLFLALLALPGSAAMYGDIKEDGEINVHDVVMVMRHVLALEPLEDHQVLLADVNSDGAADVRDATLIMQRSLELIDHFPDLPDAAPGLIEDFLVEEGLSPGKKFVIILLDTPDPQEYTVSVDNTELSYNEDIDGFRGEVDEDDAELGKVKVEENE